MKALVAKKTLLATREGVQRETERERGEGLVYKKGKATTVIRRNNWSTFLNCYTNLSSCVIQLLRGSTEGSEIPPCLLRVLRITVVAFNKFRMVQLLQAIHHNLH
jgi:hypothetical protein